MNKERVIFWLKRRIKALQNEMTMEEMANRGMSYDSRQKMVAKMEKEKSVNEDELIDLQELVEYLEVAPKK